MCRKIAIIITLLTSVLSAQGQYRTVPQAEEDWQDYTQFQKHELLSFCDFLIEEGFYERALLSLFQYLYRYPGDRLEPVVYYFIAQSYGFSDNPDLAKLYYNRVQEISLDTDLAYRAAQYQKLLLLYFAGEYGQILSETELTKDPYELTLRGYAFFKKLKWIEARQSFLAAEEQFDHPYYSIHLEPLFKAIDAAANVPLRNKWLSLAASFIPGGGHAYLGQWESAGGAFVSMMLISAMVNSTSLTQSGNFSFFVSNQNIIPLSNGIITENNAFTLQRGYQGSLDIKLSTTNIKLIIPPFVVGAGMYIGSIWKTWMDVDEANKRRVEDFVGSTTRTIPIHKFMDFPEPELFLK